MVDQFGTIFKMVGMCAECHFIGYDDPIPLKRLSNKLHYNLIHGIKDQLHKTMSIEEIVKIEGCKMPKVVPSEPNFLVLKYSDGSLRVELLTHNHMPFHLRVGFEVTVWDSPINLEHAKNYLKGSITYEELCDKNILVYQPAIGKKNKNEEKKAK
jgi:hypothetical protein